MKVEIKPGRAVGVVSAPPSKSMAHRLLICAGLSKGESKVYGIAPSQDVLATLDCLKALGADFTYENDTVVINGADINSVPDNAVLDCRECGSTLRFFIPIALLTGKRISLRGSETLMQRPLSVYEELCRQKGFEFKRKDGEITVCGSLSFGEYTVNGNISSQFISGLLFALSCLKEDSIINILPPVESRPYIDMTLSALKSFGIDAFWKNDTTLFISGAYAYSAREMSVEGDYSNTAFFEALRLLGGDVKISGLCPNSLQGDKIYLELFEKLKSPSPKINISDCPDLGPVLMAAAAALNGAHFTGTKRLKIKESDRGAAMKAELEKFSVAVDLYEDEIIVHPSRLKKPTEILHGHNDHRIVMALSVLSTLTGAVIADAQAVNISFPDILSRL